MVFLALPLLTLALAGREPASGWRAALLLAFLGWGSAVLVSSEALSPFHALTFAPVLLLWLALDAALVCWLLRQRRAGKKWPAMAIAADGFERVLAAGCGVLLALTAVTAFVAPPNTPDVLSYHLPRQLIWLQQGGVQNFVSSDARALMMPPLAEMIQAHALLLAGGDHWANFPQWLAYVVVIAAASLLARELGAGGRGQWLAAFACATLPMAYLEASSAKNDLLVAAWLAIAGWVAFRADDAGRGPIPSWIALGVALGLALATKTTAWIFLPPVAMLAATTLRWNGRGALAAIAAVALLAGPHWMRNQAWFGTPLGEQRAEDGGAQGNEDFSWRGVASIALRNAALHLATPSPELNRRLESAVIGAHRWIGRDVRDDRTTLLGVGYSVDWRPDAEMSAGGPAQWILGFAAIALLLTTGHGRGAPGRLAASVALGFLLFCLLLKWQPWGARLQLPLFPPLVALLAWSLEKFGRGLTVAVAALLAIGWVPSADVDIRPLWTPPSLFTGSRWENYFRTHPEDRAPMEACLRAIAAAHVRSLDVVHKHGFPYPLMRRYLDEAGPEARFWLQPLDGTRNFPEGVVVVERFGYWLPLYLHLPDAPERYRAAGATDPFGFFVPESRARALAAELPLPNFVGWRQAEGLGGLEPANENGKSVMFRRLTAPQAVLDFPTEAPRMHVHLEVINSGPQACPLELHVNGTRIGRLQFDAVAGRQSVDVPFTPAAAANQITLRSDPAAAAGLLIFKLQIAD